MGLRHRKLMSESLCESYCESSNESGSCTSSCLALCPDFCDFSDSSLIPPPPSAASSDDHPNKQKFLIITLSVLAAAFILLCLYAIYIKNFSRWSASRRRTQPETDETRDEFLDEDHGPALDHPIWYIQTVGLQPSVINSITVFNYRKGDGLVEGTDCSVCLSEFEEDETLRLLPKCSHAFHVPCIDTWLRSHINCPMCRAPIVTNTGGTPSSEANNLGAHDETLLRVLEDNGDSMREIEDRVGELRTREEEEESEVAGETGRKRCDSSDEEIGEVQPMRRSISLDSLSASKISHALTRVLQLESDGNASDSQLTDRKESRIVAKAAEGSQCLLSVVGSSSIRRSLQNRSLSLKRSLSFSGKFLSPSCRKSCNSGLPL